MKITIYIIMAIALALIVYNFTKLDFQNLFEGESMIGVISIVASACVLLLMIILMASRKIAKKK